MAQIFREATEYVSNELTILRGNVSEITFVGVFHTIDPDIVPTVAQFTQVALVDGINNPSNPLARTGKLEVMSLIGPGVHADLVLTPGDYQRWILVRTATEDIIRRPDVLEVI